MTPDVLEESLPGDLEVSWDSPRIRVSRKSQVRAYQASSLMYVCVCVDGWTNGQTDE